jgi:hypothetical protein
LNVLRSMDAEQLLLPRRPTLEPVASLREPLILLAARRGEESNWLRRRDLVTVSECLCLLVNKLNNAKAAVRCDRMNGPGINFDEVSVCHSTAASVCRSTASAASNQRCF